MALAKHSSSAVALYSNLVNAIAPDFFPSGLAADTIAQRNATDAEGRLTCRL